MLYSHSVVPGGFGVRSYKTREIPGIFIILSAVSLKNCNDNNNSNNKKQ